MPGSRGSWGSKPARGGKAIPETVKWSTEQRIQQYAREHFAGKYARLEIRFRGQFCYVDAFTEPEPPRPGWPPPDWHETPEEYVERLRNTPTHLCRLRYSGGPDRWEFAFYTYSNQKYETSIFATGEFIGTPEDAFELAANAYLQ